MTRLGLSICERALARGDIRVESRPRHAPWTPSAHGAIVSGGMAAIDSLDRHCQIVARRLGTGSVVPFLGAGANLCGRPAGADWAGGPLPAERRRARRVPGRAVRLSRARSRPAPRLAVGRPRQQPAGARRRAARASSAATTCRTSCTRSSPSCRARSATKGSAICGQLVLTTNYDDVLERAFAEADEPVDVVVYETRRDEQRFVHLRPDGERVPIDERGHLPRVRARGAVGDPEDPRRRRPRGPRPRHVRRHRGPLHRLPRRRERTRRSSPRT